ncbi:hypothetical protein MANES_09G066602v8 [Manihot esculenta]|uniref:Uncharacterized protein n=1 Tax=Manihot esculenta TaxID=3983 RepID=A0ACB7H3I0_MANES|nr:hypothetical protein MANES_09G066602v8 [Manihot esculenta]
MALGAEKAIMEKYSQPCCMGTQTALSTYGSVGRFLCPRLFQSPCGSSVISSSVHFLIPFPISNSRLACPGISI